jgi:transcriptional regulator with XRE-family HTH domain
LINERRAFGDRLRRQRERQHVTLTEIARSTKVAASLFAGLERGDCSRWPGGVYNRAFIRGYATAIQLDPDEITAEFVEYYEASAEADASRPAKGGRDSPLHAALRLGLAIDPTESWRRGLKALLLTFADMAAIALVAVVVVLSIGAPVWNALAIAGIGYHVLARIVAATSRTDRVWLKSKAAPAVDLESDDEVPVSGTASTVA